MPAFLHPRSVRAFCATVLFVAVSVRRGSSQTASSTSEAPVTINWINSLMIACRDDGTVSIERTKVNGMKDHLVVHVSHPFLMRDSAVIPAAVRFIAHGKFGASPPAPALL